MKRFRARFDGQVFIPLEPVDLPIDVPFTMQIRVIDHDGQASPDVDESAGHTAAPEAPRVDDKGDQD
jgi:hypothetical protein